MVGRCTISAGSRQVGKECASFESSGRSLQVSTLIRNSDSRQLTIRPTVKLQEEASLSTLCTQDPPIRSQHVNIHINLLRGLSDL
jgi:hypothetical protein